MIDLHVHSTCSDGTLSPSQLVDLAIKNNVTTFALTDHDCVQGIDEAIEYAKDKSPEIIPGIELSTQNEGCDIHIVGLYIDHKNDKFNEYLIDFVNDRDIRNERMCLRLTEHNMDITYSELMDTFPDAVITRAHFGKLMLAKGYVKSIKEAFERYIGDGKPCFIPREKVTPVHAIEQIHVAGGYAILAHPMQYRMGNDKLDKFVKYLKENGLDGIECKYTTHTSTDERILKELAGKYNLLKSGGSDFHGTNKPDIDLGKGHGSLYIDESYLTPFHEALKLR